MSEANARATAVVVAARTQGAVRGGVRAAIEVVVLRAGSWSAGIRVPAKERCCARVVSGQGGVSLPGFCSSTAEAEQNTDCDETYIERQKTKGTHSDLNHESPVPYTYTTPVTGIRLSLKYDE